jgi:hypothetical protein
MTPCNHFLVPTCCFQLFPRCCPVVKCLLFSLTKNNTPTGPNTTSWIWYIYLVNATEKMSYVETNFEIPTFLNTPCTVSSTLCFGTQLQRGTGKISSSPSEIDLHPAEDLVSRNGNTPNSWMVYFVENPIFLNGWFRA